MLKHGCFGKWWAVQDLPSGHFPDGKCLQAGLAVFAFRPFVLKQKHRCAFQILPRAKQFARLLSCINKKIHV